MPDSPNPRNRFNLKLYNPSGVSNSMIAADYLGTFLRKQVENEAEVFISREIAA